MSMTLARSSYCLRFELLNGATATTDVATADITTADEIVMCIGTADTTAVMVDRTATITIPADGYIESSADCSGENLLLLWNDITV